MTLEEKERRYYRFFDKYTRKDVIKQCPVCGCYTYEYRKFDTELGTSALVVTNTLKYGKQIIVSYRNDLFYGNMSFCLSCNADLYALYDHNRDCILYLHRDQVPETSIYVRENIRQPYVIMPIHKAVMKEYSDARFAAVMDDVVKYLVDNDISFDDFDASV